MLSSPATSVHGIQIQIEAFFIAFISRGYRWNPRKFWSRLSNIVRKRQVGYGRYSSSFPSKNSNASMMRETQWWYAPLRIEATNGQMHAVQQVMRLSLLEETTDFWQFRRQRYAMAIHSPSCKLSVVNGYGTCMKAYECSNYEKSRPFRRCRNSR